MEQQLFSNYETIDLVQVDWSWPRDKKRDTIIECLKTVGFFMIVNVPWHDEEKLLQWGKWLMELPQEDKKRLHLSYWNPDNPNTYRGLAPFIDNDQSHVEIYLMGNDYDSVTENEKDYYLQEPNPWPLWLDKGSEFMEFQKFQYKLRFNLAKEVMSIIAEGLGLQATFFDKWFERDTLSTYNVNHYVPRARGVVNNDLITGKEYEVLIHQHSDTGILTLLSTLGFPGLQVEVNGKFKSVKPVPNSFAINIGDQLSKMTNFTLKATVHRVIDIGDDRYSSPFFLEPNYEAMIPSTILFDSDTPDDLKKFDEIMYGDYMIDKVQSYAKAYNALKKGKRQQ